MLSMIFKPLYYLKIKWEVPGQISKKHFDIWLPALLSLFLSGVLVVLDIFVVIPLCSQKTPNIFDGEFATLLSGFLQTIPGFYIAALAAIATLNSATMDRPMAGIPPTEIIIETNPYREVPSAVSRRLFLSSLFAYLALLSLLLFFLTLTFKYFYNLDIFLVPNWIYETLYFINLFVFNFLFCQMIMLTLMGLYYLGDRVHRN